MQTFSEEDNRLLNFCGKLPGIPGPQSVAQTEAKFVLACFKKRRDDAEQQLAAASDNVMEVSLLRSEITALDCANRVVSEVWKRRFGGALV